MLFTLKNKATNRPPPAAGRIRPGTKKLTPNAAKNPAIVRIFDDGMARGLSYPAIAAAIEKQTQVKGALMPMNSRFYRILTGDFPLGSSVPESLKRRYGVVVEGETVFEQSQ